MAKLTIKQVNNVLNEFKTSLFIAPALEKFKINHYDFFEFINSDEEVLAEYEKICTYNNIILDDKATAEAFGPDGNPKIRLEVMKASNKKKYSTKQEIDLTTNYKALSDSELDEAIAKLMGGLTNGN